MGAENWSDIDRMCALDAGNARASRVGARQQFDPVTDPAEAARRETLADPTWMLDADDPYESTLSEDPARAVGGVWSGWNPGPPGSVAGFVPVTIVIDAEPFRRAIASIARQVAAASLISVDRAMQIISDVCAFDPGPTPHPMGVLRPSLTARPAKRPPPRRRHGTAAVCPRHGPTRGGTCLVCARGRR